MPGAVDHNHISLMPVKDCRNCEFCKRTCYAVKLAGRARPAWERNSRAFNAANDTGDWQPIIDEIVRRLRIRRSPLVRIHVAGDFLSQSHLDAWIEIATQLPNKRFLAFTKRWILFYGVLPSNLKIVFSMWPGMPDMYPPGPRAWMQDGTETRIPADATECSGHCQTCGKCWSLTGHVVFHKH